MDDCREQIKRILKKLRSARAADAGFDVFGARHHRYRLDPPASAEAVAEFEERHGIRLPNCYRQFVLSVGDGGDSTKGSGAGPFYGIYPLGMGASEIFGDRASEGLARPCVVSPGMSQEAWTALTCSLGLNGDLDDKAYEEAIAALLGGLLSIGSQGCSYVHCLVLNGPFAGRVVNLDLDRGRPPHFAYEPDFLAWYERWLDEVIAGYLRNQPAWFGYVRAGSEAELLAGYLTTDDPQIRREHLDGLINKKQLTKTTLAELVRVQPQSLDERASLCCIVTKSDYEMGKPLLRELAQQDLRSFFRCLHGIAPDKMPQWEHSILSRATQVTDADTFRLFTYLLERLNVDRGIYLVPFLRSDSADVRATAFYQLGKIPNRRDYLDCFAAGLNDTDPTVVRETLQALAGLKDSSLVAHYRRLAERFPEERDHVLVNLDHRFAEFGLSRLDPQRDRSGRSVASWITTRWRRWTTPKARL